MKLGCTDTDRVFAAGGCVPQNQSMTDCYQMDLVGDPKGHLDPNHLNSPRQRIEFRSHDGVPGEHCDELYRQGVEFRRALLTMHYVDGSAWLFTWSSYYPSTLRAF